MTRVLLLVLVLILIWFLLSAFWLCLWFLFLVFGFWFVVCCLWFLVSGFWFLVSGFWFLVSGCDLDGADISFEHCVHEEGIGGGHPEQHAVLLLQNEAVEVGVLLEHNGERGNGSDDV